MWAICERSLLSLVILFTKKGCEADSSSSSRPIHYSFQDSAAPYGSGPLLGPGFLPFLFFTPIFGIHMVMKRQSREAVLRAGLSSRLQASSWCPPSDSTGLMSGFLQHSGQVFKPAGNSMGICERLMTGFHVWPGSLQPTLSPLCPIGHSASSQVLVVVYGKKKKIIIAFV